MNWSNTITQAALKRVLKYDPLTGVFTWLKVDKYSGVEVGAVTGYKDTHGYLQIRIYGSLYRVHRLAFLYMTGSFPPDEVDHINGVKDDNGWANIRAVTHAENAKNQKLRCDNTSGVFGVYWVNTHQKWQAGMKVNGKRKHLYWGSDFFEAVCIRKAAENKYNFHPNHGRA